MKNLIVIDNEVVEVTDINEYGYGKDITCDNGCEYKVFDTQIDAGEAAREYWVDMAENDKREFVCLVGEKNLVSWCMGEAAGPGYNKVDSLDDWFDLWLDTPQEQWACYDGEEIEGAQFNNHLADELNTTDRNNIVLYRTN